MLFGKIGERSRGPIELHAAKRGWRVLAVATEWFSRHGGLSTLNRELCGALAEAGHVVFCLLPRAERDEQEDAARRGVRLIEALRSAGDDDSAALLRRAPLPEGAIPELVIGHGRITGPAARVQVEDYFQQAARIHVIHMAPGEIEGLKNEPGGMVRAEERESIEFDLSRGAKLVCPVGPRLDREVRNLLAGLKVAIHRLDPGFAPGEMAAPPAALQVLVQGRAEEWLLKGLDIAVCAIAALPAPGRPLESDPVLVVRGAPAGAGDDLQRWLAALVSIPSDRIRVREYSSSPERLASDLRRASLVLMPSRTEGFGLVGLEAIASGVPVLVSDRSGLGELLTEDLGAALATCFVVKTSGDRARDASEWARVIEPVLRDKKFAFERANELRHRLAGKLTWVEAIRGIEAALSGVGVERPR